MDNIEAQLKQFGAKDVAELAAKLESVVKDITQKNTEITELEI